MDRLIDCSSLDENSVNVLNIKHPNTFRCQVYRYMVGHSTLIISAREANKVSMVGDLFLTFSPVKFFSAPMSWTGLNLCVAPLDEYGTLMQKMQSSKKLTQLDFPISYNLEPTKFGRLVFIETSNLRIEIICNVITITDDDSSLI